MSQCDVETPTTPGNAMEGVATPSAPIDPKKEALRKYAGLLLQHKVGSRTREGDAIVREGRETTRTTTDEGTCAI